MKYKNNFEVLKGNTKNKKAFDRLMKRTPLIRSKKRNTDKSESK